MKHLEDHEYADAVAGLELAPEAAEHLSGCLSCRQQVADLQKAVADRRAVMEAESPDWAHQKMEVLSRLPAASMAGRSIARRWLRPVLAVAAMVVLAVGVRILMPHGTAVQPTNLDLPIEQILADVDAVLADDSLPGFESIDLGVDDPESYFENGTS